MTSPICSTKSCSSGVVSTAFVLLDHRCDVATRTIMRAIAPNRNIEENVDPPLSRTSLDPTRKLLLLLLLLLSARRRVSPMLVLSFLLPFHPLSVHMRFGLSGPFLYFIIFFCVESRYSPMACLRLTRAYWTGLTFAFA